MAAATSFSPNLVGYTIYRDGLHLRLRQVAGTGAYGVVYLAQDLTTPEDDPRMYAVKCLPRHEPGSDLESLQKREITYHKMMTYHPHVAKLHQVVAEEMYVFLVMDYYDSGDLFGAIIDRKTFSHKDDLIKDAFLQLLAAVEACHDEGIYHRDLKPENILCSCHEQRCRLYLSDFGLATQTAVSGSFGCGSAYYMSPECIGMPDLDNTPYSTRHSDIWSLGVILTNLITGRNPWKIANALQDAGYAFYLKEGCTYLANALPISFGAAQILSSIFHPDPLCRVTIPELREAITSIPSFYPTPEDDEEGDEIEEHVHNTLVASLGIQEDLTLIDALSARFSSITANDLSTISLFSPEIEITESEFVNRSSHSSDSSDRSSCGPTTPQSPAVEIPEFNFISTLALDDGESVTAMPPKEPEAQRHLLMGALHEIASEGHSRSII